MALIFLYQYRESDMAQETESTVTAWQKVVNTVVHVERWSERARRDNAKLNSIAGDLCWDRAPERSRSVAFAAYRNITADSRLWCRSDEFVPAEVPRIRAALEAALVA